MAKYFIFAANYFPNLGGVERYTCNLGKKLIEHGNEVVIVTSNLFGLESISREDGMMIYRLPALKLLGGRFPVIKPNKKWFELNRLLKEEKPDYIIVNTRFYLHSLFGVWFAKNQRLPSIVIEHGSSHLTLSNRFMDAFIRIWEHVITALVKRYCCHFYGVSTRANEWLEHFNIKAKGTLFNSINIVDFSSVVATKSYRKFYSIPEEACVVAFTGRLLREKGVEKLLKAFKMYNNKNLYLLIAGDGDLFSVVKEQASNNIIPLGRIEFQHVVSLLRESDIFCFPSDYPEGFPTSLLEAAVCRCFIITSNCGGAKELLPSNEYGIVLEQNTPKAICMALQYAISNKSNLQRATELSYIRLMDNFTWKSTVQNVRKIFEGV